MLEKTLTAYAALKSYSDTGSVDTEFGPKNGLVREHHTFKTFFRAPRHFLLDFVKADNAEGLLGQADIDGALVGGASLDAAGYGKIIEAAQRLAAGAEQG
mgnify:CR=1 FL=1